MKHNHKSPDRGTRYILCAVVLFSIAVTAIDAFVHPPYFSKIPIKIVFFLALPLLYFFIRKDGRKTLSTLFGFRRQGLLTAVLLGTALYVLILGAYFLLRGVIDFSGVTKSLTEDMGITRTLFPYVAVYIAVFNSFLEEFFFRGFGFFPLRQTMSVRFAYLFSPVLFALYHVGMLVGMFHPAVLVLLMLGLIAGGLIFNALNDRFGCLYPSWFVHMSANLAINTIGFLLFDAV